jgi:hypothetical protein
VGALADGFDAWRAAYPVELEISVISVISVVNRPKPLPLL